MKIILFIASIDITAGGTTEYIRLLSSELKNQIQLIIVTKDSAQPISIKGVSVKFFSTSIFRWSAMMKEFLVFLEAEKPNLVHINGIWSPENWGFQKASQALGIKVIVSTHGMLEPWIMSHNKCKNKSGMFLYQKKAVQRATFLHATAQMESDHIQALGFKTPICIIPNGIDISDIKGIKTHYGTRKMVFLSRIHPKKGIELLLEAWRNCNTDGWSLEIAGDGDENYIAQLNESALNLKNVHFVGAKYGESKWNFLRSADAMVLPTHSENFGIVVAEALAMGIPVITTHGAPWQDLETYECGWWIDLSVSNIEKAIIDVTQTSTDVLKTMGNNGRKLVAEKYDIKLVATKIVEFYQQVLN